MLKNKRIVKVPEGLLAKANEQGLYNLLIFWYNLKSQKREGTFQKQELFNLGYSKSFTYKQIARLRSLGWIKENNNIIQLCKYDNLFEFFKYNLKRDINKYGQRIGKFKIFKVSFNNFRDNIAKAEIELLFNRQNYIISKKIRLSRGKNPDTEIKLDKRTKFRRSDINFKNLISCRKLSSLLGFKSPSVGYNIEKNLEKSNQIIITRRVDKYNLPCCNLLVLL